MADLSFSLGDVLTLTGPVLAVAAAYYKLNSSISTIQQGNSALREVVTGYIKGFGSLIGHLSKKQTLDTQEVADILRTSTSEAVENLLGMLTAGNPITPEEARMLQGYYAKMQSGYALTEEEANDFYNLSSRVSQEHPVDAGALFLLALAAFGLGYFMGSSDKGSKSRR